MSVLACFAVSDEKAGAWLQHSKAVISPSHGQRRVPPSTHVPQRWARLVNGCEHGFAQRGVASPRTVS
jgi:hypothetical protein